jgi:cell division protein ZapA
MPDFPLQGMGIEEKTISAQFECFMHPIKVRILDNEYMIKSQEEEERVHEIAAYVNDKLLEIIEQTEGLTESKRAILVALNIASDYFQVIKERDDLRSRIDQKTESLIHSIDSMMD